ncbi:DUF2336 domain-containing protein [Hephaestia sp. GCM10023244]|uniref:DUF2336 domain-containing protein n=1 Tax=unclassified Hephaestia TaxID=2631281 RepID=UPI002076E9DA|nr:DUF2336 domain-containing protein [Hephaestia sp. MAHUQ-44]MCM8730164.1 DUF2336 domain-containing protein [Hephaestia sp. MAHUQ-44]
MRAHDDDRLDDRTRAAFGLLLVSLIGTIRGELVAQTVPMLRAGGEAALADILRTERGHDHRLSTIVLADPVVLRELDGRVRQDLLTEALVSHERDDSERPSLLPRLASERDPMIAGPAMTMLLALSRRTVPRTGGALASTDLSAEAHHRFVWHVAADLRDAAGTITDAQGTALDRALIAAAERSLAAHDEGTGLEPSAIRLAAALASARRGGAQVAVEAIGDRLLALFIALVAEETGLDYHQVRDAVLDRDSARLWLMLRAMGMERAALGRVGLALVAADQRRSIDVLADDLDAIADLDPVAARATFADQTLPAAYREARAALGDCR